MFATLVDGWMVIDIPGDRPAAETAINLYNHDWRVLLYFYFYFYVPSTPSFTRLRLVICSVRVVLYEIMRSDSRATRSSGYSIFG